jgi:hypothetical protein
MENKKGLNSVKPKKDDIMCWTEEGKYIVDGKEILIDYTDEQIPIAVLQQLEKSNMSQLDAFYIRKNVHRIAKMFDKLSVQLDERIVEVENRMNIADKEFKEFTEHEITCQVEKVPDIASKVVHSIVNGKFDKISKALESIAEKQEAQHTVLDDYKKYQQIQHDLIIDKVQSVSDKTIFGWIKRQYETKPLRTLFIGGIVSVILFLYVMTTLGIHSFTDMFEWIMKWFK